MSAVVHTGPAAEAAAASVRSIAFTVGRHVVLSAMAATAPEPLRSRVLAHELGHVAAHRPGPPATIERFDEAATLSSSLTAAGVAAMTDEELRRELLAADQALAGEQLGDRDWVRQNRDLVESELRARRLTPHLAEPVGERFSYDGITFSADPTQVRQALATAVAIRGTEETDQMVDDLASIAGEPPSGMTRFQVGLHVWQTKPARASRRPTFTEVDLIARQWATFRADNEAFVTATAAIGRQIMLDVLDRSLDQVLGEADRYGWTTDRFYLGRVDYEWNLAQEAELGRAAADLIAKRDAVADRTEAQRELDRLATLPHLADGARPDAGVAEVRRDFLFAQARYLQWFPVLATYLSRGDWEGLEELAADPTHWDYGDRIRDTIDNILDVREALEEGETSVWKQDRIVLLLRALLGIPPGSGVRSRLISEAVQDAEDDDLWQIGLVVLAIGLSLVAAIPTGGLSLGATAVIVGAEVGAIALDAYLIGQALADYELAAAAAGSDLDIAKAVSSQQPSALWLAIDLVAAGLGATGAARAFRELTAAAAASRAATRSDELAAGAARLSDAMEAAGLSADAKRRLLAEATPEGLHPEDLRRSVEAGPSAAGSGRVGSALSDDFPAIDRDAGEYLYFALDDLGRATGAEGWIARATGQAPDVPGWGSGIDRGHLIPEQYGGHGARTNIVPMVGRLNRSHVKTLEDAIGREGQQSPIYLRVFVRYVDDTDYPGSVVHELYRRADDGGMALAWSAETAVMTQTGSTLRQAVRPYGSISEYYGPGPAGTAGQLPH